MFGPPDPELKAAEETVDKRLAVINERLVPLLDSTAEDLENASDKTSTLCAALATVMAKVFVTKCPKALAIIDKIPTFVSKEKKKEKFLAKFLNSDVVVQGHHFQLNHYDQVPLQLLVGVCHVNLPGDLLQPQSRDHLGCGTSRLQM